MEKTIDEALANAAGAASAWAAVAWADGFAIPKPRAIETLRRDPEIAAEIRGRCRAFDRATIIESGRPAKANLSLDAGLLQAIDEAAGAKGLTRSAFIASAAREKIIAEG
jgi:hypothetical protein